MAKFVYEFMENVAVHNGLNPDPSELLEAMKLRGKVTPLEDEVRNIRTEYQDIIDGLVEQLEAIKAQGLTPDELVLLASYRECKATIGDQYQVRIDAYEAQLQEIKNEHENRLAQIMGILTR